MIDDSVIEYFESTYRMVNAFSKYEHEFKDTEVLLEDRHTMFNLVLSNKVTVDQFNDIVNKIEDQICRNEIYMRGILQLCRTGK